MADFATVFIHLRALLAKHEAELVVVHDEPVHYYLNTRQEFRGKPLMFGAVKAGKNYVSYHLMPVYVHPELLEGVSEGLRKRMQGKSCFNFREVDEALFAELAELTARGLARLREGGLA